MSLGDIYCVKVFQTLYSQDVLNVFFYEQSSTGTPDDAEGLFEAFDAEVLSDFVGCVSDQLDIIRMEVFRPSTPTDFFDGAPSNNKGLRSAPGGDRSPSYLSFGFRSNRAGPGTRASFKRFAGLIESDMDANSLSATFLALAPVIALQGVMGDEIDDGVTGPSYIPIQVKHPVPLGFLPIKNYDITSWSLPFLTSQVSRKPPAGT